MLNDDVRIAISTPQMAHDDSRGRHELLFACLQRERGSPVGAPMTIRFGPLGVRGKAKAHGAHAKARLRFPMVSPASYAGEMACSQSAGGGVRCRIEEVP